MVKKEIWRPCPGYEKYYDVSNMGNFRSYHINNGSGMYNRKLVPKPIRPSYSPTFEYWYVNLSRGIGVVKTHSIHILVAKAFVANQNNRKYVHHKDNDKQNPCADNLEWVTIGQNQKYAYADGQRKRPFGELNGRCKLSPEDVLVIFKSKENHYKLASKYGVKRGAIGNIKSGKLWSNLTGKKYKKKKPLKKLSKLEILEIFKSPLMNIELAKLYKVSRGRISSIKTGRAYSDVTSVKFTGKTEYFYYGLKSSIKKVA